MTLKPIKRNPSLLRNNETPFRYKKIEAKSNGKRDMLTGRRRNKSNKVSFSNKKWRKWQDINSQTKKIFWPAGQRLVKLRISTKTNKTIDKKGLAVMAKDA